MTHRLISHAVLQTKCWEKHGREHVVDRAELIELHDFPTDHVQLLQGPLGSFLVVRMHGVEKLYELLMSNRPLTNELINER